MLTNGDVSHDMAASGSDSGPKNTSLSEQKADALVISFGVKDHRPPISTDLLFNCDEDEDEEREIREHLGKRAPHDITIEQYNSCPQWDTLDSEVTRSSVKDPTKVSFFSGIPAVACVNGVLHLFKSKQPKAVCSEVVCVLCVPAQMRLLDMLDFLSPVQKSINSLQVIRDATPNQYMMVVKFNTKECANEFFTAYNGKRYNSLEKGLCQLAYVKRVEIVKSPMHSLKKSLIEIPSCPVCLERLDESVLTILCNHSFHTSCLTQWQDSTTCPVCRYMQTPDPVGGDNTCSSCDSKEDLWICLICGTVGCGRYVGGHANNHFAETQHTFAMHLDTRRVWDYIGDNYVHRLVQNKSDGKLVEVQQAGVSGEEKMDSIQLEYTYLLTTQLESQRLFFEEKIARFEKELNEQLLNAQSRCRDMMSMKDILEEEVAELKKEKQVAEKRYTQLQEKLAKISQDLSEEKELNRCLSENQKVWKEKANTLEAKMESSIQQSSQEIQELRDQVRDLMFYLETQKKIEGSPEDARQEIQEGQLVVSTAVGQQKATPSRRKKKK